MSKDLFSYNDFELLDQIAQKNDEALEIMYAKYRYLILARIKRFNIVDSQKDDFLQEGMMALHTAIQTFRPEMKMSFTNYFDLILTRRFITVLRTLDKYRNNNLLVADAREYEVNEAPVEYDVHLPINIGCLSLYEQQIYQLRFLENYKPREIAKLLHTEVKTIYNAILRIRNKLQSQLTEKEIESTK